MKPTEARASSRAQLRTGGAGSALPWSGAALPGWVVFGVAAVWISDAILSCSWCRALARTADSADPGAVLLTQAATLVTVTYFRHKFMEDVAIGYIVTTIRTCARPFRRCRPRSARNSCARPRRTSGGCGRGCCRSRRGCSASAAAIRRRPGRAEAAAGQRHARAARAGDMTREEDEERRRPRGRAHARPPRRRLALSVRGR